MFCNNREAQLNSEPELTGLQIVAPISHLLRAKLHTHIHKKMICTSDSLIDRTINTYMHKWNIIQRKFRILHSSSPLSYTAVDCGSLPFLLNGSPVGNITTYPNEVTFLCDDGFLLRGSARRFCQANRTWSGTRTICEGEDNFRWLT